MNAYTQNQTNTMKGTGSILVGVLLLICGGVLVLGGLLAAIGIPMIEEVTFPLRVFVCLLLLGGVILLLLGGRRCSLYSLGQRVNGLMKGKPREGLYALSRATGKDYTRLVRDLRELSTRQFFPGAYVDLNRREFVLHPGGPQGPIAQGKTRLQETHKKSVAPLYMVGVTWLVCALVLPMYRITDFLTAAVLSVGVVLLSSRMFPKRIIIKEVVRKEEPPKPPEKINTGNEELDEVLATAMKYMSELAVLEEAITSEQIAKPVKGLVRVCQQIFDYIKKTPDKVRQIRQFMNYYLPTTIKLLKNYDELSRQPVKGENIQKAMAKIEDTILVIKQAFEKELDSLYADKAMDITVDIEVLENMMEQEGLTASSMDSMRANS